MVCQWQLDLMCLGGGGEQEEGYHVNSEWLAFAQREHWWKMGKYRQEQ
jgi:hypothetical protein